MELRAGPSDYRVADRKKTRFRLGDLAGWRRADGARELAFGGALEDRCGGPTNRAPIRRPGQAEGERRWRGGNFFPVPELTGQRGLVRGEDPLRGRRNRRRWHGLSKKGQTYKYYLTELGRRAVLVGLKRKKHLLVPGWAAASAGAAKYLAPPAPDFPGRD